MTQDITIHLTNGESISVFDFDEALVSEGVLRVIGAEETIYGFPLASVLYSVSTHD
jgi:hypothetical protein